jgi:hypothetical protein
MAQVRCSCGAQNDLANIQCAFCGAQLPLDSDQDKGANAAQYPKSGESVACWFCGTAKPTAWANATAYMYSDYRVQFNRRTWKEHVLPIPRCSRCAAAHRRLREVKLWVLGCTFVVGALIPSLGGGDAGGAFMGGALFSLAALPVVWLIGRYRLLPPQIKGIAHGRRYPGLDHARQRGWTLGFAGSSWTSLFRSIAGSVR